MCHKEVKWDKDNIDLLWVEVEASFEELWQNLDVHVTLSYLLLCYEARNQGLGQGQSWMLSCNQVTSLEDLGLVLRYDLSQWL